MREVVIVEDEKLVLLGIESLFEGNSTYRVIGSYSRASSALEALVHLHPDIIITDIKMPGMDGLAFIKNLQERNSEAHIVILSCLEDFSVVSQAFKLGAVDYLLKHELDEQELFDTLDSLCIEKKTHNEKDYMEPWSEYRRFSDQIEQLHTGEISYDQPLLCLIVCKKQYTENHLPQKVGVDTMWLLRLLRDLITQYPHLGEVYWEEAHTLVLLLDRTSEKQEMRKNFFNQLTRKLIQYINSPVIILRSDCEKNPTILDQWESLQKHKEWLFYINTTKVVQHAFSSPKEIKVAPLPDPIGLFQHERISLWEKMMSSYFGSMHRMNMDPSQLCMELIMYDQQVQKIQKSLYLCSVQAGEKELNLFEYLREFDDFFHLQSWYIKHLLEKTSLLRELHGNSHKIMRVKLLLLQQYDQHITLQQVAKQLHMNSNYLSELFKRETQVGFIEYVNSIRIQKAQELLLRSNVTVEEVSLQVGYTSASHFSRLFKRIVGQTVSEYKASHNR